RFRNGNHPHLIQLLATYRHGEYYYLVFPCAEGNLMDFWMRNSEPQKTYQLALWIASQCRGIAEGLRAIHNDEFENASLTPSELNRGRHGDIKPENILWFKSSTNMEQRGDDILKISDFGLTRWHREVSSNQTDGVGVFVSKTYRAPEYDLKKSPSQSWDIWALACLYLEFLTWYLLGWEKGVDEFSRQRAAESSSSIREDNYFNVEPATGSEFGASLKQCMMTWINRLHATEGCSLFIHDFLDIIQDGMLLIHHDKRLESKEIHHRLANLYEICRENKVYCFESVHKS
ncbi:kinase domain-containing protein, partial [Hypoxylon sp. EC38]